MNEIFLVLWNVLVNIGSILLYMMPFGIFDSISYFIDIYSNPTFITIIFIFSTLMWIFFLVYFFELLNIPIHPDNTIWMSEDEVEKEETLLWATLSFIFWKSNFSIYFPKLVEFFAQVRYKIIPIFIILLIMYVPLLPTTHNYHTVGEFFNDNRNFVYYSAFGDSYMNKAEIDRLLKYKKLKTEEKDKNILLYKDTNIILKDLSKNTISDSNLNAEIDSEVNMYSNIYDKKSFDKYIQNLAIQKKAIEDNIAKLNAKKEATSNKEELKNIIEQLNKEKEKKKHLEESLKWANDLYKNLTYKIDQANVEKLKLRLQSESWYNKLLINILNNKLDILNNSKSSKDIIDEYNTIIDLLKSSKDNKINYTWTDKNLTNIANNISDYLSEKTNKWILIAKDSIISLLKDEQNSISEKVSKEYVKNKIDELETKQSWLDKDIISLNDIWNNPKARLNYIINENAVALSSYPIWTNEDKRQYLLLLQYKLLNKKEKISSWEALKIQLLQNKVEYIGLKNIKEFWYFIAFISAILTFLYYITIILLAWWKNILILYISFLTWFNQKVEEFSGSKNINEKVNAHISMIVREIFWEDTSKNMNNFKTNNGDENNIESITNNITDPEYKFFIEHKDSRETYIIMIVEIIIRFWLIWWLFYL